MRIIKGQINFIIKQCWTFKMNKNLDAILTTFPQKNRQLHKFHKVLNMKSLSN